MRGDEGAARVFRSKVGGPFIVAAAVVFGMGGTAMASAVAGGSVVHVVIFALPMVLLAWMILTTQYTVTETDLQLRCLFSRRSIPLRSIQRLRPSRNPLAAPALSLDRIEITHAGGVALVSPRDRHGFVRAIVERSPEVDAQGV